MKTIKGPGIFLAQFAGDAAPFNSLEGMAGWAAGLGFVGMQIPTWDARLFDLKLAAESQAYCDQVKGIAARAGMAVTELSTHLQGQLVAGHPAYDVLFGGFAPARNRRRPQSPSGVGRAAVGLGRQSQSQPGPQCPRHLLRRARVAIRLSLAAASRGSHRRSIQGAGRPLATHPAPV